MSQITTKWIADAAITPVKVDTSGDFFMHGVDATHANFIDATVANLLINNAVFQDATVINNLIVGNDASVANNVQIFRKLGVGQDATSPFRTVEIHDQISSGVGVNLKNGTGSPAEYSIIVGGGSGAGADGLLIKDEQTGTSSLQIVNDLVTVPEFQATDSTVTNDGSIGNNLVVGNQFQALDATATNNLIVGNDATIGNQLNVQNNISIIGQDSVPAFNVVGPLGQFIITPYSDHYSVVSSAAPLSLGVQNGFDMTLIPTGKLQIMADTSFQSSDVAINTGNMTINTGYLHVNGGDITSTNDIHASGAMSAGTTIFCNNGIFTYGDSSVGTGPLTIPFYSGIPKLTVISTKDGIVAQTDSTYTAIRGANVSGDYQSVGVYGQASGDGTAVFGYNSAGGTAGSFSGKVNISGDTTISSGLRVNAPIAVYSGGNNLSITGNDLVFNRNNPSYIRNDAGTSSSVIVAVDSTNITLCNRDVFQSYKRFQGVDATFSEGVTVGKDCTIGESILINQDAFVLGKVNITGDTSVQSGNFFANGDASFLGDVKINGDASVLNGNLFVNGDASVLNGNLFVNGDASVLNGNLFVNGDASFSGDITGTSISASSAIITGNVTSNSRIIRPSYGMDGSDLTPVLIDPGKYGLDITNDKDYFRITDSTVNVYALKIPNGVFSGDKVYLSMKSGVVGHITFKNGYGVVSVSGYGSLYLDSDILTTTPKCYCFIYDSEISVWKNV